MPMMKKRLPPSASSKTPVTKAGTGEGEGEESDSDLSALSSPSGSPAPVAGPSTIRVPRSTSIGAGSAASSALSDLDEDDRGDEEEGEEGRDDRSATSSTVPLDPLEVGSDDESDLTEEEEVAEVEEIGEDEEEDEEEDEDEQLERLEASSPAEQIDSGAVENVEEEGDLEVKKETLEEAVGEGSRKRRRSTRDKSSPTKPAKRASLPPSPAIAEEEDEDDLTPPPPTSDLVRPAELPSSPPGDGPAEEEDAPMQSSPAVPTSELTDEGDKEDAGAIVEDEGDEGDQGEEDGDVTMRPGDVNGVLDALAEMGAHATVQEEAPAGGEEDGEMANEDGDAEAGEEEQEAQDGDDTDSVAFSAIPTRLTSHSSHAPLPTPAATKALLLLEIKFAGLRDRLYMERMEEAAEEEEMLLAGTHPALTYLYKTLSERREKLHEAASRRHKQVIEELARCRENEETAVWSWWTDERDRVHWEEFEQTWSKRRRLAREKNELETPKTAKPIPRPSADRPLKLDWSSGYTPSKLSMDEANHDLALMENRRPPQYVPRSLPTILAQYPELQSGPSNNQPHYPEEVDRAPRTYTQSHGSSTAYPRQNAAPIHSYASQPPPSHQPQQAPQNPPSRTLSNPAQVFNSLASGAPPDPSVSRQIGSSGSTSSLGRYPSSENIPPSSLLGSSTYGPPIPSPLGGLSTGTSSIGQSALGLTGRTVPTTGMSFFQPPPPPTAHAENPGISKSMSSPLFGHQPETLGQRIERHRREKEREKEMELMRERQKYHLKYATQPAPKPPSPVEGRVDDTKKEESVPNGTAAGNGVRSPPIHQPVTATADLLSSAARHAQSGAQSELEVKRDSVPATPVKSPTPTKTTSMTQSPLKVNGTGNGPTRHIEIINIHDPVPSPLPAPAPAIAPLKSPIPPNAPEVEASKAASPNRVETSQMPIAQPKHTTPLPQSAQGELEEDVAMIPPASPPSSSFEGPSISASIPAKEDDRMEVDGDPARSISPTKLEQLSGSAAAISAT